MEKIKLDYSNNLFLINQSSYQNLNEKGYGEKVGNFYNLDCYEAIYLLEKDKVEILKDNKILNFEQIVKKAKIDLKNYLVYKDLRSKGYIVKSGLKYGFSFRVYDKGIKIGEDHSLWLIDAVYERENISFKDLTGKNRTAHSTKKKMIIAIIDSQNQVTYLENNWKRL